MSKNRLEADSITLSFGLRDILSNIYLKCEQGKITGLLGRNGSGKSSLMKIIFGAMKADSKSIRINDIPMMNSYIKSSSISYLPQQSLIPPDVTFEKALALFKISKSIIQLEFPELEKSLKHKPFQFSGGELRLAELCLILYSKAQFCLLDEPFSGLSPIMIENIKAILQKRKVEKGIVITDHLYQHVTGISDRLYILSNRQTREIQEPGQLITHGYVSKL